MKLTRFISTIIAVASIAFVASCGEDNAAAENSDRKPETSGADDAYPLTVCVVSGEELGSMGKPYVIEHEGTEVRFCCKDCLPKFKEDPDTYLAKLKAGSDNPSESSTPDQ